MRAKEWLEENECANIQIDYDALAHSTMLDTLMEQYAKHYMSETLKDISNKTKTKINKFI